MTSESLGQNGTQPAFELIKLAPEQSRAAAAMLEQSHKLGNLTIGSNMFAFTEGGDVRADGVNRMLRGVMHSHGNEDNPYTGLSMVRTGLGPDAENTIPVIMPASPSLARPQIDMLAARLAQETNELLQAVESPLRVPEL